MVQKISAVILVASLAVNFTVAGIWGYHHFYLNPRLEMHEAKLRAARMERGRFDRDRDAERGWCDGDKRDEWRGDRRRPECGDEDEKKKLWLRKALEFDFPPVWERTAFFLVKSGKTDGDCDSSGHGPESARRENDGDWDVRDGGFLNDRWMIW